jgi:uncharacterized membrane protein
MSPPNTQVVDLKKAHPFRSAVIRGLGVLTPPLLTVLILLWVINTTREYLLVPVNAGVREALVWCLSGDIREGLTVTDKDERIATVDGIPYKERDGGRFVPLSVYERVQRNTESESIPSTAKGIYQRYVEVTYLQPHYAIPCFLAVFILLVYILGKLMAAGIGGFVGDRVDMVIQRLPLIRSIYKAVKQVCDFFFSERQIQFKRVVAVEFPRPGMWSIAFVTSDGLSDIRAAANDAVLGVFIPSSPMPVSGYSLTVLKREAVDLNISIEEAIQYLVSCGLVMPQKDLQRLKATDSNPLVPALSVPADGTALREMAESGDGNASAKSTTQEKKIESGNKLPHSKR